MHFESDLVGHSARRDEECRLFAQQRSSLFLQAIDRGILAEYIVAHVGRRTGDTDRNFKPTVIRPPGSVPERAFLERCIKCDQCINICPTNVLQPAGLAVTGLEGLWTPLMDFSVGFAAKGKELICLLL